ncbi:ATP-binding protein [Salipiger sp. 1_MG-2023]|uniref:ATP-binding protein n=1 Tax=Salipiger sp. 1_MG-2023 TaxID=3062665 RepID=UPI0034C61D6F
MDLGQIRKLATGRFIANGEAVLLLGPPAVGKTHLAVAIGLGALALDGKRGLVDWLHEKIREEEDH